MGNRAWIQIDSNKHESVSFYGHWSGDDNLKAVQEVLEVSERIGDPSYLAAQIFWHFANLGGYDGKLSFGIYGGPAGTDYDDVPTVYVDADTGYYRYDDVEYNRYGEPTLDPEEPGEDDE